MTKTVQDVIAEARSAATTLIERRQSAKLPELEEMQAFGHALGELIALTERLEQAVKPFASVAELMRPLGAFETWPDDKENHTFTPGAWPCWGDFKRAAETLRPAK